MRLGKHQTSAPLCTSLPWTINSVSIPSRMRLKSAVIVLLAYNALDAGVCITQSTLDSYGEHRTF